MSKLSYCIKPALLSLLIVAGFALKADRASAQSTETLTVAGGCFWCVESDFEKVNGVSEVISGYTGGTTENPTYKEVTGSDTGHYEAVQIQFDPSVVSRDQLLTLFFRSVDPTDAGGQFCDRGDSYRTAIFVADQAEADRAAEIRAAAQAELGQTIVTPIIGQSSFYPAEAYHQDYYKGDNIVVTRRGPKRQSDAYEFYRNACGRDARVEQLWGPDAPFINHSG